MSTPVVRYDALKVAEPATRGKLPTLHEIQTKFQNGVLSNDPAVLDLLCDNSRTTRDVLFGVYQHAYVGRLVDILKNDHPLLLLYLGDEAFTNVARRYIEAHPSRNQNARWYSNLFSAFLNETEADAIELAELASLERAVNNAFDAPDVRILEFGDLAAIPPEHWSQLVFVPHPSASLIELRSNAYDLWLSLKDNQNVPPAERHRAEYVLAWRRGTTPATRRLGPEETMMWKEAIKGVQFGVLCEMAATFDDPAGAAIRAAGYLQGWIVSGLITDFILSSSPADAS